MCGCESSKGQYVARLDVISRLFDSMLYSFVGINDPQKAEQNYRAASKIHRDRMIGSHHAIEDRHVEVPLWLGVLTRVYPFLARTMMYFVQRHLAESAVADCYCASRLSFSDNKSHLSQFFVSVVPIPPCQNPRLSTSWGHVAAPPTHSACNCHDLPSPRKYQRTSRVWDMPPLR